MSEFAGALVAPCSHLLIHTSHSHLLLHCSQVSESAGALVALAISSAEARTAVMTAGAIPLIVGLLTTGENDIYLYVYIYIQLYIYIKIPRS